MSRGRSLSTNEAIVALSEYVPHLRAIDGNLPRCENAGVMLGQGQFIILMRDTANSANADVTHALTFPAEVPMEHALHSAEMVIHAPFN